MLFVQNYVKTSIIVLIVTAMVVLITPPLCRAKTKKILRLDPKRTVRFIGRIDATIIEAANNLLAITTKDKGKKKKPVFIVINSPGGLVVPAFQLVNIMRIIKKRGYQIHCIVPMFAESMAFSIFAECTSRYAFYYSIFMWHPIRAQLGFGTALTPNVAEALSRDMRRYEEYLVDDLKRALRIKDDAFYQHYYNETRHIAVSLKKLSPRFLTLIDDAVGVNDLFTMKP